MSFPKILLPTITATGLISGSIITISNLSSSTKSNIQNTKLKENDNSSDLANNFFKEEKIKEKVEKLFEKVWKNFNDLVNKVTKTALDDNTSQKYLKVIDEMSKTSKIPTSSNLERLKEIDKQIQEVSDLLKELNREKI